MEVSEVILAQANVYSMVSSAIMVMELVVVLIRIQVPTHFLLMVWDHFVMLAPKASLVYLPVFDQELRSEEECALVEMMVEQEALLNL